MNEIVVPPLTAASHRIAFANDRPGFRRLVMRGALLELVTVGFYRFWLATDIRRHLWSHTSVDGDAAEYTGTAKELLIGFLFALAIFAPMYLVYFLIGLEAERLQAFASIPLALFFYLFFQFAIYRARRYRLTRTVWRGLRFSMGGSGWNYAWRAGLWTLLVAVTFGLALPWRQAALERFKMRYTSYGNLQGRFASTGWELFKRFWWLWLAPVVLIISPIALAAARAPTNPPIVFTGLAYIMLLVSSPFLYALYKAFEWRWWLSGIGLGQVSFESDFEPTALVGIYYKVLGWGLLISVIFGALITGLLMAAATSIEFGATYAEKISMALQGVPVLIGMGALYVIGALAFGVVMRIYLAHDVWSRVSASVTVHNLAAAEAVAAQGPLVGALGEGFADSLDVAGF